MVRPDTTRSSRRRGWHLRPSGGLRMALCVGPQPSRPFAEPRTDGRKR